MASQLVGLVAAASVGGNVQQGAEIAGNVQAYNRQLHSFERKILDEKAQELQQTLGNTKSGVSWETLLTLVGNAAVDNEDSQKLAALEAGLKDNNPENVNLRQDLAQAQQVIDQLKSQRIALHWSNGDPIVADGDKVYAFSATDAQRQDHALFDVASNTGLYNAPGNDPVVPDKYVQQFGDYVAAKHQSEIASVSSSTLAKDDAWAALRGRTNGGLVDVTGAEALDVLPAGRTAKVGITLSRTLQATTREAEESIAGGLAKAVSQDSSRTGVPQWTVAAEDGYGARLAGSYKAGDTAYNGAAASDSAYDFGSLLDKTPAADVGPTYSQQRSFWKNVVEFDGNKVYQRNNLFDPDFVSSWREGGRVVTGTNIERMASGRAPIGVDGKSINLHHTIQTQSGPIAEMTQTFHQQNSSVIHINPNTIPSGIDRSSFDKWKGQYWQQRAAEHGGAQ